MKHESIVMQPDNMMKNGNIFAIIFVATILTLVGCSKDPLSSSGNDYGNRDTVENFTDDENDNQIEDEADYTDNEFILPSKYSGTAKITVIYANTADASTFATKTYSRPVEVFIDYPKRISLTSTKEINDLNLVIRTLPDVVLNQYAGELYICSATTAAPSGTPNLSSNLLFQFWDLDVDGTSIEGTIRNTYKEYNPTVFANYLTIETVSGTPRLLSRFLEDVSVLSAEITDEYADIEIIGIVAGGTPNYACAFKCIISAKID
jgi:hypothetical protein